MLGTELVVAPEEVTQDVVEDRDQSQNTLLFVDKPEGGQLDCPRHTVETLLFATHRGVQLGAHQQQLRLNVTEAYDRQNAL